MKARRRHGGFTLIEIIIVLAVISALIAIITPRFFPFIDEAKHTQAQGDARQIAVAMQAMYKDTGRWPFYYDGRGQLAYIAGTDAQILTSNTACNGGAANTCDTTVPDDATAGNSWELATAVTDNLTNHLIRNRPFNLAGGTDNDYRMNGQRAWKGPYLDRISSVDPWGRSYLVNIANADPGNEGAETQLRVLVISAGPDGELDTLANAFGTGDPEPVDDDIIARVK